MSVNVLYVFAFIVLKVQFTFLKWPVVGRTTSVIGRRPPWPYPGYATNLTTSSHYVIVSTKITTAVL